MIINHGENSSAGLGKALSIEGEVRPSRGKFLLRGRDRGGDEGIKKKKKKKNTRARRRRKRLRPRREKKDPKGHRRLGRTDLSWAHSI